MIVVDASAILEVLLHREAAPDVSRRISDPRETLHAPHLLDLEVLQVLRRACVVGGLSPHDAREALEDFADFDFTRYPHYPFLGRIWELRHNVSAYDAAYLALAEALDAPVVTCDRAMAAFPGVLAKVELFQVQ